MVIKMKKQTTEVKDKRGYYKIKMRQILIIAGMLYGIFGMKISAICVQAAQDVQEADVIQDESQTKSYNQLMVAERDVDMKAEPDADAQTLMTYKKGDLVFSTGETADGWYLVIYQDINGYVEKEALVVQELDVEGLDAEMAMYEQEGKLVMETVEKYRAEAKRSKIWGGVIITLVAAIFAVGIYSAVKTKKEEDSGKVREQGVEIEDWNV